MSGVALTFSYHPGFMQGQIYTVYEIFLAEMR